VRTEAIGRSELKDGKVDEVNSVKSNANAFATVNFLPALSAVARVASTIEPISASSSSASSSSASPLMQGMTDAGINAGCKNLGRFSLRDALAADRVIGFPRNSSITWLV
jgi:hypothetical protein